MECSDMPFFSEALRSRVRLILIGSMTLLGPLVVHPQAPAGEIDLRVKDPSGADMQASGELENLANGSMRSFKTDPEGYYVFGALPFARYRLEITREGFATESLLIDVQSGTPVSRTVTMALGTAPTVLDVVATTPLAGGDLALEQIPAPVQLATQDDLKKSGSLDLSDFLNRRLGDVNVNENQGNPFQPDINYRGYTASPLLGTPEGVSVYMDGVRLNQPFGDIVSWDLIPKIAISEVTLIPGSNPMFGLNTLGGAISLESRDGHTNSGATIQVSGGSYGRRSVEAEYGGSSGSGLNWYAAGNLFH